MKKLYESPEVEITKFQVESLMDDGGIPDTSTGFEDDWTNPEENIFGF